jgi:thiol reductant ABC exporter CydC subunit
MIPNVAPDKPAPFWQTLALARSGGRQLALATTLGAASIAAGIGLLATSGWLISRASQHPSIAAFGVAVVGVRFFAVSRGIFRYGERLVGHDSALRSLADIRALFYERFERLTPSRRGEFRGGDLLSRLVADVDSLQDLTLRVVQPYGIALVVGVATVGVIWWLLPAAGVVLAVTLVLAATVVPWLTRTLARRSEARQAGARGELTASVVDLLDGAQELVAFGAVGAQLGKVAATDAELTRVAAASARTAGVGSGLTALFAGLAVWGAVMVGVPAVGSGALPGVQLAVIVLAPLAAFELVIALPGAAQSFERVRGAAARVFTVLEAPTAVGEPLVPANLPPPPHSVRVRGLRAKYETTGPWVLDGVDLDLSPGRRVGIVGPSGAGKTTLAHVLCRLMPYAEGSVQLDGIELSHLAGDDARRAIGLVEQGAHVFDTTLRQNLLLARRNATDHEMRSALARVGLLAWVDTLPTGLDTHVGAHGASLSGGQRQRLALARGLLAEFPIVILDEPGEHLDAETADALTADIITATAGTTTLMITHRLKVLETMDEVIVLDGGRVVQRGSHESMIRSSGRYARLWQVEQFGLLSHAAGGWSVQLSVGSSDRKETP